MSPLSERPELTIEEVSHTDGGLYQCCADDRFGEPKFKKMKNLEPFSIQYIQRDAGNIKVHITSIHILFHSFVCCQFTSFRVLYFCVLKTCGFFSPTKVKSRQTAFP